MICASNKKPTLENPATAKNTQKIKKKVKNSICLFD
jgi:hypothetical protein